MPYYNLRRLADHEILSAVCSDDKEALDAFGQKLGLTLTLDEAASGPSYLMGRREESLGWIKTDIPVWAKQ